MNTWTPTAMQTLAEFLHRTRRTVQRTGADPDEVEADLRRHVEEEINALQLPIVTETDVKRIVRKIDPVQDEKPEALWESEASDRPALQTPRPPHAPRPSLALFIFGVIQPIGVIAYELLTRFCTANLVDPLPTWTHVVLACLVPLANGLAWAALRNNLSPLPGWLWPLNGAAAAVAAWHTLVFLPVTHFSFMAVFLLGLGLLPLTPLISLVCTLWMRHHLKSAMPGNCPARWWAGSAAAVIVTLASLAAPERLTRHWMDQAGANTAESARAIQNLRRWGNADVLLGAAYGQPDRSWAQPFQRRWNDSGAAQRLFYQVTGKPYNAYPPPASLHQPEAIGLRNAFEWDSALGGQAVAGKVRHLSLVQSRMDGLCNADEGWAYLEWIMEFRNDHRTLQREARAQILLPPGAAVSRLTLWINGEEREAAFAGRGQVREAYEKVAVQQRRDPVLVTTSGPDRVLMQCFPIAPAGGTMKVRLGITVPLQPEDAKHAAMKLPSLVESNFGMKASLRHEFWLESPQPAEPGLASIKTVQAGSGRFTASGPMSDAELGAAPSALRLPLSSNAATARAKDRHTAAIIRQSLEAGDGPRPERIAVVLDGSAGMESFAAEAADALRSLPTAAEVKIWRAGDNVETLFSGTGGRPRQIAEAVANARFEGGQDNVPALVEACDWARTAKDGVVLWIHGPQPILLSGAEPLKQRLEWRRASNGPLLLDVPMDASPNRIAEQLESLDGFAPLFRTGSLKNDLKRAAETWSGERKSFRFAREAEADSKTGNESSSSVAAASSHVVRLWALEQVRLLIKSRRITEAVKTAALHQLVTPVTGAVVLETLRQFEQAGLSPVDALTVPTVPEPRTIALWIIGALFVFAARNRLAKARGK